MLTKYRKRVTKKVKKELTFHTFIVYLRYTIKEREIMAQSKKDSFNLEDLQLAEFAKALSHPARIEILRVLAKKNSCICGEIVDVMPLAQSTVSQHLKELQKAGLISGEIEGPRSCYCINWENLNKMSDKIKKLFNELEKFSIKCEC